MRLTLVLNKQPIRWLLKNKWLQKGKFNQYPASPPKPVLARGVEVVEAAQLFQDDSPRPAEPWQKPDHPLFDPDPCPEDHPDYHARAVCDFRRDTRVHQGEPQMCVLTKTQAFGHLPPGVTSLMGAAEVPGQDELTQRYILQANRWDPSDDRLPKRYNNRLPGWKFKREWGIGYEKRTRILLQRLVGLSRALGGYYPDLLHDRMVHGNVFLNVHFTHQDKAVLVRDPVEHLVTSRRPLAPFGGEEVVEASTRHALPDLYPLLPTIDLQKTHVYRDADFSGFEGGVEARHPHTMFLRVRKWPAHQVNANMLAFLFAQATLAARHRFGPEVRTLPEPVCLQAVASDGANFQFACFQLNTLDLSSAHGVKNLVWFDNDNHMYQRLEPARAMLRNTLYQDYDPEVLTKILALYVNGADLSVRDWHHPSDAEPEAGLSRPQANLRL